MYSMFRRGSEPVRCPFKGPFTFSYSKGGSGLNQCSFPKSYLDSCSDHRRLQVHFQACIDVQGSESAVEQMECLAHWKEGSKHYMVAEMSHDHVHLGEGALRGELWLALRDGGGGQGGEVLEVHDHLQEAPQRPSVQRE